MALPPGLPVVDHHCHLSPHGEGVRAAERFRAAGGTHLFLATQNYEAVTPSDLDVYARQFATTEALALRIREETGVVAYPVVAPYPVDLVHVAEQRGIEDALGLHLRALDLAGREVAEHRAVALGEVGRPHFAVPESVQAACDEAFRHALGVARDVGCPVVVHSADLDTAGFEALGRESRTAGLRPQQVVKHYTRNRLPAPALHGVVPSYLAQRDLAREVLHDAGPWFLETDFLDDPKRPGAVLDIATVPRRAKTLAGESSDAAELLWTPFVTSIEKVYGVRPEVAAGRLP